MTIILAIIATILALPAGCMLLAYLTAHEATASGCIEEGQVW